MFIPVQPTPPRLTITTDLKHLPNPSPVLSDKLTDKPRLDGTSSTVETPSINPSPPSPMPACDIPPTDRQLPTVVTPPVKPPLALRRLLDFNAKGMKE